MFVSKDKYRKIYYEAVRKTFSSEVKKLCNYYKKALEGGDKVRIVAADGTCLSFRIKWRKILVADGIIDEEDIRKGDVGLNIPDGECFCVPLENSANGFIIFD